MATLITKCKSREGLQRVVHPQSIRIQRSSLPTFELLGTVTLHTCKPRTQTMTAVPSAPICKQSIDRSLYSALLAASFCLSKVKQSKVTQISSNLGRYVGIWLYSKRLMSYGMRMKPKNDAVQTGWFMHAWRIRKLSASFFLVVFVVIAGRFQLFIYTIPSVSPANS